jgi:hypothetical protein
LHGHQAGVAGFRPDFSVGTTQYGHGTFEIHVHAAFSFTLTTQESAPNRRHKIVSPNFIVAAFAKHSKAPRKR